MPKPEDIERSRTISDAELLKGGAEYKIDQDAHEKILIPLPEQIEAIHKRVEELFAAGLLTPELIRESDLDVSFSLQEGMPFDYAIERERRAYIRVHGLEEREWKNHTVDYYDASGRIRVREKNGNFIFGLKIPLFSQDTAASKACIRLQLKPITDGQKEIMRGIRELLAAEPGSIRKEKLGMPIVLKDGSAAWLNKNTRGDYWIEAEGETPIHELLPEGLEFVEYRKSEIIISP